MSLELFEYVLIALLLASALLHVLTIADERVDVLLAASEGVAFDSEQVIMYAPEPVTNATATFRQRVRAWVDGIVPASSTPSTSSLNPETVTDFDNNPEQAQSAA